MDLKNITGLEKPLEKLIEVVSEGIGETANAFFEFDAKKLKRIGETEAEIEKTKIIKKAEGYEKAVEILGRAEKRFALEQYNKQINLENIIVGAKEKLEGTIVSDQPVEKDWSFRFMNIAQDVSRKDIQEILSKILAEEIKKPNTFSLWTLDFIKNLSKNDLISFRKFSNISHENSEIYITKDNADDGFFNITYSEIMEMIERGFIQPSIETISVFKDVKIGQIFTFKAKGGDSYIFKSTEEIGKVYIPVLSLTIVGKEIASLLDIEEKDKYTLLEYVEDLKKFFKTKKLDFFEKI